MRWKTFVLRWTRGTIIGLFLAYLTGFVIFGIADIVLSRPNMQLPLSIHHLLFVAAFFLAILSTGATVGMVQWHFTLRGKLEKWRWAGATAISAVLGLLALMGSTQAVPSIFSSTENTYRGTMSDTIFFLADTWFSSIVVIGIVFGIGVGLPQWIVLRRSVNNASLWLVGNVLASVSALMLSVILLGTWNGLRAFCSGICCMSPMTFAIITGSVFYRLLYRSKAIP